MLPHQSWRFASCESTLRKIYYLIRLLVMFPSRSQRFTYVSRLNSIELANSRNRILFTCGSHLRNPLAHFANNKLNIYYNCSESPSCANKRGFLGFLCFSDRQHQWTSKMKTLQLRPSRHSRITIT